MSPSRRTGEEPTIGKLVVDASRDVSALIKHEIELAKSELKVSVRAGGISIGLFAAAGFLVLLAIIMLSVAFAYFIAMIFDLDLAWCFLIVFVVYVLLAGLLGFIGVKHDQEGQAPGARHRAGQADPGGVQAQQLRLTRRTPGDCSGTPWSCSGVAHARGDHAITRLAG